MFAKNFVGVGHAVVITLVYTNWHVYIGPNLLNPQIVLVRFIITFTTQDKMKL